MLVRRALMRIEGVTVPDTFAWTARAPTSVLLNKADRELAVHPGFVQLAEQLACLNFGGEGTRLELPTRFAAGRVPPASAVVWGPDLSWHRA